MRWLMLLLAACLLARGQLMTGLPLCSWNLVRLKANGERRVFAGGTLHVLLSIANQAKASAKAPYAGSLTGNATVALSLPFGVRFKKAAVKIRDMSTRALVRDVGKKSASSAITPPLVGPKAIQWANLTLPRGTKIKFQIKMQVSPCAWGFLHFEPSAVFRRAAMPECVVKAPPLTVAIKASHHKHKKHGETCLPTPVPTVSPTGAPSAVPPYVEVATGSACLEDLLPGEFGRRGRLERGRRLVAGQEQDQDQDQEHGKRRQGPGLVEREHKQAADPPAPASLRELDTSTASRIYNVTRDQCAVYW